MAHNFYLQMTGKLPVQEAFLKMLDDKIAALDKVLLELFESVRNETKSTAGDKHETALAHLQIAQKQAADQLAILKNNRALVCKIDASIITTDVRLGSLVKTKNSCYFISAGIGKILIENTTIYAIALQAPVGIELSGLRNGSTFSFNGKKDQIIDLI